MLRKLTSEVLERRTVFSASAIVPLGGDAPAFMDYTDDAVVAAAPQAPAAAVTGDFNGDADVDGADFLVWQRGLRKGAANTPTGHAADAVMEQLGRDPQGIIAILIGLYAPRPGGGTAQGLQLENAWISSVSVAKVPQNGQVEQAAGEATSSAPQPYLQLELENTLVSSLAAPRERQQGVLHEDNEFSFPRM